MSRSRRKTPITGITTSESDRYWKNQCNRRLRRRPVEEELPNHGRYKPYGGDPWMSQKDGKFYFGNDDEPKLWRK